MRNVFKRRTLLALYISPCILACLTLAGTPYLHAQELTPAKPPLTLDEMVKNKRYLNDSVFFQILPKGFKFFDNNIYNLISYQTGLQIEENTYPPQDIHLQPIQTEELIGKKPENLEILQKVRNFIGTWFSGMKLSSSHEFIIKLGNTSYQTRFTKSSLYLDDQLLKALNKKSGAVLVLELRAQKLALFTDSVRVSDRKNPIIQSLGFNSLQINVNNRNSGQEIQFKVPFYVEIDKNSNLKVNLIRLDHNIQDLNINYKYKKIITGRYKIITEDENGKNQQVVEFNSAGLKDVLEENNDLVLTELKKAIVDFANNTLVELINKEIQNMAALSMTFSDVVGIPEPKKYGAKQDPQTPTAPPEALVIGLKMNSNFRQENGLRFNLDTYIEDLKNPNLNLAGTKNPPYKLESSSNNPNLAKSDAILALDLNLANRVIQILHNRKYLQNMEQTSCDNKKSWLTMTEPLVIKPAKQKYHTGFISKKPYTAKTYDFLQSKISLQVPVPAEYKKYFNGPFELSFEAVLRVQPGYCSDTIMALDKDQKLVKQKIINKNKTCIEIFLDRPLIETLKVDTKNFGVLVRLVSLFTDKITKEAKNTLEESFKPCAGKSEEPLIENLPIPPQFFGIGFDILDLKVDNNGHLVFFLNIKNVEP